MKPANYLILGTAPLTALRRSDSSVSELNARLGDGELGKMFFSRRSSKTKLTPSMAGPRARPPAVG